MTTHVFLPNKLALASDDLSLLGRRLRTFAMSKLTPINYVFGYSPPIVITAQEWWLAVFAESENPYRDMKRALDSLAEAKVSFPPYQESYSFLSAYEHQGSEGEVVLRFCPMFLKMCVE